MGSLRALHHESVSRHTAKRRILSRPLSRTNGVSSNQYAPSALSCVAHGCSWPVPKSTQVEDDALLVFGRACCIVRDHMRSELDPCHACWTKDLLHRDHTQFD